MTPDRRSSGEGTLQTSVAGTSHSRAHVIVASMVAVLVGLRWAGVRKGIWVDLDVYVRGAGALLRHESLYAVTVHGLPFTYPPFAALAFVPFELIGDDAARWALTLASIGCYLLVVVLCTRRLGINLAAGGLVGLVGLSLEPFVRNILLGQINLVLLALVVVDCFVVPSRYRGMLIGLATGIKILPGVFIFFLLLRREWGAALRCVAAFTATVGLGTIFALRDSRQFWSGGFIKLSRFGPEAIIGGDNQSLSAVYMRLSRDLSPPPILMVLLALAAMTLGLVAAKRQIDSGNDVVGLVCIAFASLLASPISWTHHWVWVVPALLVLVQGRHRVAAVFLAAIFVIGPMWYAPRGNLLELKHNFWQATACVSYVLVGLIFLSFFAVTRSVPSSSEAGGQLAEQT